MLHYIAELKNHPSLQEYFGTFGEIDNVKLKMDQMTGRSRGFAFVLYKDEEGVEKATAGTEHTIKVVIFSAVLAVDYHGFV